MGKKLKLSSFKTQRTGSGQLHLLPYKCKKPALNTFVCTHFIVLQISCPPTPSLMCHHLLQSGRTLQLCTRKAFRSSGRPAYPFFCRWRQPTMISWKSQEFSDVRASCRKRHMVLFPMMLLFRDLPRKYGSNVFLDPSYSLSSPSPTYSAIKTSLNFFSRKVFISSLGR